MTDLTEEETARLRELEAKATPGPWEAGTTALGGGLLHRPIITAPMEQLPRPFLVAESLNSAGDANLIAALRNAAPALLDAAERAETWRVKAITAEANDQVSRDFLAVADKRALAAEAERDRLREEMSAARDDAATFVLECLVKALRLEKWTICDGSETWEGDVRGTLYGILREAGALGANTDEPASVERDRLAARVAALEAGLRPLVDAADGLSRGSDWNAGTHASYHGYRHRLLDALPRARALLNPETTNDQG